MITLENLPSIEGGTDKQKMFADSVRLQMIALVEQDIPERLNDLDILVALRTHYKWWIDRAKKIDSRNTKIALTAAKNAIKTHGSLQAARQAQQDALERQQEFFKNSEILGGILRHPAT